MQAVREALAIGTRVRLRCDVDRYPDFVARAGATGTVVLNDAYLLAVRMDAPIRGAEEWDNQVEWRWAEDDAEVVAEDVEILA